MKTSLELSAPELTSIEPSRAKQIQSTFAPMVEMLEGFESDYNAIKKESKKEITVDLVGRAKRLRIDIGKVRIETEKTRKIQKEEFLRAGKAIDGVSNILKWAVSEKENDLKDIECHFEKLEEERIEKERVRLEALQHKREEELAKYVDDATGRDLSGMDQDVWDAFIEKKRQELNDRIEAERKADELRKEEEAKEAERREKMRIENERLKKEAEKREAEIKAEREKAEKERLKIEAERQKEAEKREAVEAELRRKNEAERVEAERKKAEQKAAKVKAEKAAKAPVQKQMNVWVDSFEIPDIGIENTAKSSILSRFEDFKTWAKSEIENI